MAVIASVLLAATQCNRIGGVRNFPDIFPVSREFGVATGAKLRDREFPNEPRARKPSDPIRFEFVDRTAAAGVWGYEGGSRRPKRQTRTPLASAAALT